MFSQDLLHLAKSALMACAKTGDKIAVAESCTAGLITGCLTAVPGSSDVVDRGFVTYSNEAKTEMLGVATDLIDKNGAVSEAVARAMAEGALSNSNATVAASVTGVAGPGGGSVEKPVGLVHIAVSGEGRATVHQRCQFSGDRDQVRAQAIAAVLKLISESV